MIDSGFPPRAKPPAKSRPKASAGKKKTSPRKKPGSAAAARTVFRPLRGDWAGLGGLWARCGRLGTALRRSGTELWRRLRRSCAGSPWWSRFRFGRRWRIAGLVALGLLIGALAADQLGVELGLSRAVTAFNVALGLEPKEDETFTECLKGATEGAFSTAVPVAEIVVAGEFALASPVLVVMGAGLGCSLGTINSMASAGAGWAVHTGTELWHGLLGH